ncbi:MAG: hypothetical protein PWP08_227 [Methanofollis sp.]|nr:hypothetical protein [Methanofollis sp.]
MPAKKTLTLGITVNLDNYENLRLEVSGEVESNTDADELAGFLDATLSRLGRGDEATAERVDAYRKRVFSIKTAKKSAEAREQTVLTPAEAKIPLEPVAMPGPVPEGVKDASETAPTAAAPEQTIISDPLPAAAATPAPETPVKKAPEPVTTPMLCEECGADVTKTQKQMSQLFLNRTLCKACMDRLTHSR